MRVHKKRILLVALLCAVMSAASCSGGGSAPSPAKTEATTAAVSSGTTTAEEQVSVTEDTSRETTELTDADTPRADSSDVSQETEALTGTVEESAAETEYAETEYAETEYAETEYAETEPAETEPDDTESAETTTEAVTTTEAAAVTTAETTAAVTTTTVTTTTAAETTTTTTAAVTTTTAETTKAPAQPSPPQISEVSSPGKNVFGADNVTLDYSNSSLGYISVDYTGSTRLKMLLKKGDSQFDYDIYPAKGAQYFTLAQGSGQYTAEVYEMLDNGKFAKLIGEEFGAKISDEIGMFRYRNQFVNFNSGSACVAKASEVCAGCNTNIEKIAAVFKYVTDNITYDKALAASVTSGYIPDPDSVLAKKQGICFDYASLTAAMLRSQGVPARLIIGYASPNIYHAWNEVYTPEKGWIAAEIALDGTGFRRIDATFYASATDKQTFADYIARSGNYSDVYVY